MSREFPIHWIEEIVDKIIARKPNVAVISTGKTTSGRIHVGIMRELIISDAITRRLKTRGYKAKFQFFVDDFDAAKKFPPDIPKEFKKYVGMTFNVIPDPYECHESYGKHFAMELIDTFKEFGLNPEIIWTHEFYEKEETREAIRTALKKVDIIRKIYEKYVAPTLAEDQRDSYIKELQHWYPLMVICEKCKHILGKRNGKIIPNRISDFDAERDVVEYTCNHCGHHGTVSISKGTIKLTWRVDWPAKWAITKVTCEPAGKDHCVKGGAYDTGLEICKEVFGYEGPIKVPYEWVRLGEYDMKTHKGITFTPSDFLAIAPPEVLRYLILKTDPMRGISIKPEFLPRLMDEFEDFEKKYYSDRCDDFTKYLYPLVYPDEKTPDHVFRIPFRFAIMMTQIEDILGHEKVIEKCKEMVMKIYNIKYNDISDDDIKRIESTLKRAKNWLERYAPSKLKFRITDNIEEIKNKLTKEEKEGILRVAEAIKTQDMTENELQNYIFQVGNSVKGLSPKRLFRAIYMAILNQKSGPRLAPLLLALDKKWVIDRLMAVASD
ncbi:MAG: lysine--tRNA ligase [Candidatus Asgardarchaeia archaeon]